MNYSTALLESIEAAQILAGHYQGNTLDTWHLLTAMANNPYSVAGSVLNDYPMQIDEFQDAAEHITGQAFQSDNRYEIFPFSYRMEAIMKHAKEIAQVLHAKTLGTEHVLLSLLADRGTLASQVMEFAGFAFTEQDKGVPVASLRKNLEDKAGWDKNDIKAIRNLYRAQNPNRQTMGNMMGMPPSTSGGLEDYTRDLTEMARAGQLEPVIGRDAEISRMIQILSRKTKNNPVLVGEAGVGKTALALGLAQRVASGNVPAEIAQMRVLELDLMNVVAGTRFRGDFEERMNNIIQDIEEDGHVILFIDELHTIMGSGSGIDSTLDAANILKPALARGTLRTVGATTQDEYQKHIEKDAALSRRFAKVTIEEPSVADSIQILDLLDEAAATVQNRDSNGHVKEELTALDRALMDGKWKKAAQLLQVEAAPIVYKKEVTDQDVLVTLSQLSGIPTQKLTQTDAKKYLNLETELHKRVIGQDQAVSSISRAIRRNQSGIRSNKRPIGSFMFLGPTGVGKTELAKALAEVLFDDESALIRFDMSEYMEKFAASRLNGAPPGYVGYEEGGELTEKVRNKPYSVLLFDEVEKAHPDIFNVLLQVLDDGVLTDSKGRKIDFSNTIIIMTSNLGATALRDDKTVGFGAKDIRFDQVNMEKRMFEELKKTYRPEFINRIDEKVVFHSLSSEDMQQVVKVMVKPLIATLAEQGMILKFQPSALKLLATKGYDPEMGARPLRRVLQTEVEDQLAELLLKGQVQEGQTIKVGTTAGTIKFEIV